MSRILYYVILKPLSYLPLSVLYVLSDGVYVLLYRMFGFRKKVVLTNLRNSFPEKSEAEIQEIAAKFYQHLCDIIIEAVRMFSMPKAELLRRCPVTNPELLDQYAAQGKGVIIVAGHYNNWELAAVACGLQIAHDTMGIYHPLSDDFMDKKLLQSRGRFGMDLVHKKSVKKYYEDNKHRLVASMYGADQSPSNAKKAYWMRFLNQDTAVPYGAEKYAKEYNLPVLYGAVSKLRRGYYEMTFQTLEDTPSESPYGRISELHTKALETQILEAPEYWLWTHRRWKKKREEAM